MDPLSITASVIGVLQATTAIGQGLRKILALRHAPVELQALFNDVEALRALVTNLGTSTQDVKSEEALSLLLNPVQNVVLELDQLVQYQLTHPDRLDENGRPTISKSGWLKAGSKIERIRRRIRDARSNLETELSAQNLRATSEVQTIAFASHDVLTQLRAEQQLHFNDILAVLNYHRRAIPLEQDIHHPIGQTEPSVTGPGRRSPASGNVASKTASGNQGLAQERFPPVEPNSGGWRTNDTSVATQRSRPVPIPDLSEDLVPTHSHVDTPYIKTSMRTDRCSRMCPCQCHSHRTFRTPDVLQNLIGRLMLSYTHLVHPRSCDYPPCQKQARTSTFTYFLPTWLASREIQISYQASTLSGARWLVKTPVVVPAHDMVWSYVSQGNIRMLQQSFARRDYSPSVVSQSGKTLLHYAVTHSQVETFELLRREGCDLNTEDDGGHTVAAAILTHAAPDRFSLTRDELVDDMDFTTLHSAIALPGGRLTHVMLENNFRDINRRDRLGMTPLHWACGRGDVQSTRMLLQDWKANVHFRDQKGKYPLHHASRSSSLECVSLLLEAGAEVDATDHRGRTALFYSANSETVQMLAERGAMVNHQDATGTGWTALHMSIQHGRIQVVRKLLESGADPTIRTKDKSNAIMSAIKYNNPDALAILFDYIDLQSRAASDDSKQLPLQNAIDLQGRNVLHLAALFPGIEVMHTLAKADLRSVDPLKRDVRGSVPDDFFDEARSYARSIVRLPFDEEETAWRTLMESARRQNGLLVKDEDDDEDDCGIEQNDSHDPSLDALDEDENDSNETATSNEDADNDLLKARCDN